MEHKEWISIYKQRPEDGEKCVSRIAGEEGYALYPFSTVYAWASANEGRRIAY